MCGIAGIVGPGAEHRRDAVEAMLDALAHRGPDDHRVEVLPGAAIGARRLAVIDPAHGAQPVVDGRGVVVAGNGEVYGYRRVRAALGMELEGGSDLNVVAPLWHRHGPDLLAHLPGTFALALHDPSTATTMLARDPFGERPLYWAPLADGSLAFASEPEALLRSGLVERAVDRSVLAEVVRSGYVPPGSCIWQGIRSLGPGCSLVVVGAGAPVERRWWEPPEVDADLDLADAVAWFRRAAASAVADQLVADVPVGLFLSGGLDSATIAGLAALDRPDLVAFTCRVAGADESTWARATAARHGLELRVLDVPAAPAPDVLVAAARSWGEPLGDSSSVLTWLLARFAREEVTVALTGDGADELLGGYASWAGEASPAAATGPRRRHRRSRRRPGAPSGPSDLARRYSTFRTAVSAAELASLGLPAMPTDLDLSPYGHGTVEDLCRFDLDRYLPGDVLVKSDRASMAHGLEVRAPFLDRALAEGCLRLPADLKVRDGQTKVILREAMGHLWPPGLGDRPKQGFGAPVDRWLAAPGVRDLAQELLLAPGAAVAELLDPAGTASVVGRGGQPAWNLLATALWWEHHRLAPVP